MKSNSDIKILNPFIDRDLLTLEPTPKTNNPAKPVVILTGGGNSAGLSLAVHIENSNRGTTIVI